MNFLEWLGLSSARKPLEVGDAAPEAAARNEQGRMVRLAEAYGEGLTLVYFYPKSGTPGCAAQACSIRDDFEALRQRGVQVFGVSADSVKAQRRFKDRFRLPFTLLADVDGTVARAFGVPFLFGMTRRQSFLVREGRIVWRDLAASTRTQGRDVLRSLESLK